MKKTIRTDSEARLDVAANVEVQRVDAIMENLSKNPEWVYSMGAAFGKTPAETQNGLARFSETLRRLDSEIQGMWNPAYQGASKLFKRCVTKEDRAMNIREMLGLVAQNKLDIARTDAEDGIFYEPSLTDFDPTRYRVLKQKLGFWQKFLPTKAIPIGAEETKYTMYEGTGATAASSPGKMGGVPYVGIRNERFTNSVETETIGYMLTTSDQRAAAYANEPVIDELLLATKQAVGRTIDKSAFLGNSVLGLDGLINHAGVSNLQAIMGSSSRSWLNPANKTNDLVFEDINDAVGKIATDSKEQFTPEGTGFIMLIDRATFQALNRRMAAGTDTTLLEFIQRNTTAGIRQIGVLPAEFIAGTGPAGSNQAIFYPFDPQVLRFRVNPDIIWAPMQWQDLTMKFPGELIYGSVEVIYPVAMVELYDI